LLLLLLEATLSFKKLLIEAFNKKFHNVTTCVLSSNFVFKGLLDNNLLN